MKIITKNGITKSEKELVLKYVKECFKEISKKNYELRSATGGSLTMASIQVALPTLQISGNRISRAGASVIKIGLAGYRSGRKHFSEYSAFHKDPVIGSATFFTKEDALKALVAHEVSHHIQYRYGPNTSWLKNNYKKPHGEGFRTIYAILRGALCNQNINNGEENKEAASR